MSERQFFIVAFPDEETLQAYMKGALGNREVGRATEAFMLGADGVAMGSEAHVADLLAPSGSIGDEPQ